MTDTKGFLVIGYSNRGITCNEGIFKELYGPARTYHQSHGFERLATNGLELFADEKEAIKVSQYVKRTPAIFDVKVARLQIGIPEYKFSESRIIMQKVKAAGITLSFFYGPLVGTSREYYKCSELQHNSLTPFREEGEGARTLELLVLRDIEQRTKTNGKIVRWTMELKS